MGKVTLVCFHGSAERAKVETSQLVDHEIHLPRESRQRPLLVPPRPPKRRACNVCFQELAELVSMADMGVRSRR
ncbi:hypothetical protein AMC87_PD00854 (plasmid) [Rhizobium phaseoli]|nr:hypothetical protein AMC87_PD00854 [Rhizobium phaseoli]